MIFLVHFVTNELLLNFQRLQIALAPWARAILLVFENFTRAHLVEIALEVVWLPVLIIYLKQFLQSDWLREAHFLGITVQKRGNSMQK